MNFTIFPYEQSTTDYGCSKLFSNYKDYANQSLYWLLNSSVSFLGNLNRNFANRWPAHKPFPSTGISSKVSFSEMHHSQAAKYVSTSFTDDRSMRFTLGR
jgi:hypothetical protein